MDEKTEKMLSCTKKMNEILNEYLMKEDSHLSFNIGATCLSSLTANFVNAVFNEDEKKIMEFMDNFKEAVLYCLNIKKNKS